MAVEISPACAVSRTNGKSAIGRRRLIIGGTRESCIALIAAIQSSAAEAACVCPRIERVAVTAGRRLSGGKTAVSAAAIARSDAGTAVACLIAAGAVATARAQTFDVKQLEVTRGAIDLGPETMFARGVPHERGSDVNRHANEQAIFYGLTEWWKINAAVKFEKPEQDELRTAGVAIGNIFVFKALDEKRTHDAGLGWFTEVTASTHRDTTNAVVFGPIVTLKADKLAFTGNPFFEHG